MITRSKILQLNQQILASVLLVYHSLIWGITDPASHLALTFILYGLLLLWQPVWNRNIKVSKFSACLVAIFLVLIATTSPKESLIFFGLMLSGLIGSRLLIHTSLRVFDLLTLLVIIIEIALGVIPATFPQFGLPVPFSNIMQTVTLMLILMLYFAPNTQNENQIKSQIDLIHGLLAATVILILLLGGIAINLLYGIDYIDGLILTVLIISTLMFGVSWFWNPSVGYSGIRVLWNRYAMTIGGPFETWISTLATLTEEPNLTPMEYLDAACSHLVENEWINGIQWNLSPNSLLVGKNAGICVEHGLDHKNRVSLYFPSNPGIALEQHTFLLIRMAYQFYLARINQEKIRAQEHFATIHHTGARLTHDIKNILQSIKTSLDIVGEGSALPTQQALLKTNLMQISNRLETTLNKLKTPDLQQQLSKKRLDCDQWIQKRTLQYHLDSRLQFSHDIDYRVSIPVDLFDSILDNCISNALRKPSVKQIQVHLLANKKMLRLSIGDDGDAIPKHIEDNLFRYTVSSGSGMGVGLYQSAIMARAFHYEFGLSRNHPGDVCFYLSQQVSE